jgi:predicted RNase H-like nuclease (RuvC/YqgF family)
MDYAVDILNQAHKEWEKMTKEQQNNYLQQYVQDYKRKRASKTIK